MFVLAVVFKAIERVRRLMPDRITVHKYMIFFFGIFSVISNVTELCTEEKRWVVRSDGTYVRSIKRLVFLRLFRPRPKPVFAMTTGTGKLSAFFNIISTMLLLYGVKYKKPVFLLPTLGLVVADLVDDVAKAIVENILIANTCPLSFLVKYCFVSFSAIVLEMAVWNSVTLLYELFITNKLKHEVHEDAEKTS